MEWEKNLELEKSKSLPVEEKTIRPISASQRVESSWAFLINPLLLFEKVTCLAVILSIFLIWILCLTISPKLLNFQQKSKEPRISKLKFTKNPPLITIKVSNFTTNKVKIKQIFEIFRLLKQITSKKIKPSSYYNILIIYTTLMGFESDPKIPFLFR